MPSFMQIENHYEILTPFANLKIGVVGKSANTIDYSQEFERTRSEEKLLMQGITRLPGKNIVFMNQVHGNAVHTVDSYPQTDAPFIGDTDGMITSRTGLCLMIRTADCVPVYIYDPRKHVLGAAHSGWRGSRLSICRNLVKRMKDTYDCHPYLLYAYLLPSVSGESYSVNRDVADHFPDDVCERDGRLYLDLWKNIIDALLLAGLSPENIFNAGICTINRNDEFFSYRNKDSGRNLNYAFML